VHRAIVLAALASLTLAVPPLAGAQTQPDARVDPIDAEGPLPPLEPTAFSVNASVSCDGWGEAGTDTVVVFAFPDPPAAYEVSLDPREVAVPAGTGECEPGGRIAASSRLELTPDEQARAGSSYAVPVAVTLEERAGGDTVNTYGPFSARVNFTTGYRPGLETGFDADAIRGEGGDTLQAQLVVENRANGGSNVQVETLEAPSDLRVRALGAHGQLARDETRGIPVRVEDRSVHPFTSSEHELAFTVDQSSGSPELGGTAGARVTLDVTFEPWVSDVDDAAPVALAALLAGLGAITVMRTRKDQREARRLVRPPVPTRAVAHRARRLAPERPAAAALIVAGLIGALLGTLAGPVGTIAPLVLFALPGLALLAGRRFPERVRRRLPHPQPETASIQAMGLGLTAIAVGVGLDLYALWPVAGFALIAGAWLRLDRNLSRVSSRLIGLAPVLLVIAPLLEAGLVIGGFGRRLARVPVESTFVETVGVWLPFLLAFAALVVTGSHRTRVIAGVGLASIAAAAFVPAWVWTELWGATDLAAGIGFAAVLVPSLPLAGALVAELTP